MKNFLNTFTGGLLCAAAYTFPSHAMDHYVCDPDSIFEMQKGGKVTLSHRATNADKLHDLGIKGQLKSGKRLTVAIIDVGFHPKYTAPLKDKGLIHPAAFSENLILNPDEDLTNVNVVQLQRRIKIIEKTILRANKLVEQKNEIEELKNEIEGLKDLIKRKNIYHNIHDIWLKHTDTHGSGVMEAIHLIAPQAQLLPFDMLSERNPHGGNSNLNVIIARCIRKAVQYRVDVINLSRSFQPYFSINEVVEACKEATRHGIPIIIAAGNGSWKSSHTPLDVMWEPVMKTVVKNPHQDLFDQLDGKGIRFVGAVKFSKNGEEKVTHYTQHPSYNTKKHFIFTAGNNLPIHADLDPAELVAGTSFASPTFAGGYLLLEQYALDMGYPISSEDLLDIMYASGRDVHFCPSYSHGGEAAAPTLYSSDEIADLRQELLGITGDVDLFDLDDLGLLQQAAQAGLIPELTSVHPPQHEIYKSMDLVRAQKKLDEKFESIPNSVSLPVIKMEIPSQRLKTTSTAIKRRKGQLQRATGTLFYYRPGMGSLVKAVAS